MLRIDSAIAFPLASGAFDSARLILILPFVPDWGGNPVIVAENIHDKLALSQLSRKESPGNPREINQL
jgi:hypothetical protein